MFVFVVLRDVRDDVERAADNAARREWCVLLCLFVCVCMLFIVFCIVGLLITLRKQRLEMRGGESATIFGNSLPTFVFFFFYVPGPLCLSVELTGQLRNQMRHPCRRSSGI